MRTLINIMLFVMLLGLECVKTHAHDFEVDGIYYNIVSINDLTCEVTYRGTYYYDTRFTYSGEIVIPDFVQYNGRTLKVIGVGDYAFDNYDWWNKKKEPITSISLPDCIEYLGDCALAYNSITDFIVPLSLRKIGRGTFNHYVSEGIKRIYINNLESWCKIEFEDCSSSPLGLYAENTGYGADTIGIAKYKIGELYLKGKLVESISIPKSIKKINKYAFINLGSIKEVVLPEGIEKIEDFAFCNCSNLVSIKIPSTCKIINQHAFNGCSNLTNLHLSEGIEEIGPRSFKDCTSLSSVTFPSTIQSVGGGAFQGANLPLLTLSYSEVPIFLNELNIDGILYGSLIDIVKINLQREFECNYRDFINTLHDNYKCPIKVQPFRGLKSVVIGSQVKVLHRQVFGGCDLDSVVFQDSNNPLYLGYEIVKQQLLNNGNYHYQCKSLFHDKPIPFLYLGRPLKENREEFYQIQAMKEASFSYGEVFEGSKNFKSIIIGNFVADITLLDFPNYRNLSSIAFGKSVTSIPDFSKNDRIDNIVVINNIPPTAMGFANTTYLHCKLYIPKGCKAAYESADVWKNFWNISELEQDFSTLGIEKYNMSSETDETSRYTIDGIRISTPKRGINIIKMNDGTTRKMFVK